MVSLQGKIEFANGETFELNNRNLTSLDTITTDRTNITLPSYGIISNSGNISFVDYFGEIEQFIEKDLLTSDLKVELSIINLISKTTQSIGVFYTDKWSYNNNNKEVSVSLKDDLLEWQNVLLDRYISIYKKTFYELYEYLKDKTPNKFEFEELDSETETFLKNTTCYFPHFSRGSLWSQFDKLCQIAYLHIRKNNSNKVVIKHEI